MKRIIFTAIIFIAMGTVAFAQEGTAKKVKKTPEEKAQNLTNTLEKKLSLTADQKSKIYAINLEGEKQSKAGHVKGQKKDKGAKKAEMEKRDNQINAVLNGNQKKLYGDLKAEKSKSMKKHGKKETGKV